MSQAERPCITHCVKQLLSISKWAPFASVVVTTAILGLSCVNGSPEATPVLVLANPANPAIKAQEGVDRSCAAPIFGIGRPLSGPELKAASAMGFQLREVHFRDAILRSAQDVELAYRVSMKMEVRTAPNSSRTYLEPVHALECNEQNKPSAKARKLSQTMIPVLGDIHLPSLLITASADANSFDIPRIAEMTFSNGSYFSFNNQNWGRYGKVKTIDQYMDILKSRSLFNKVELREMGDGWLGIYAEKSIGHERSQLIVLLARSY